MIDPEQLQILTQLTDNLELVCKEIEKSYAKKDGEKFNKSKNEILDLQKKISNIVGS